MRSTWNIRYICSEQYGLGEKMSKSERIVFSGKEEDFLYFEEQFEARIFHLKLNKVINREVDEKDFAPSVRKNATVEQREASLRKWR